MDSNRLERMSLARFAKRRALLSVALLVVDLIFYAAFVYGAVAAEAFWLKLACALGAGTMIALTAIVGHDAGHLSFSDSRALNRFCGTIAFLPALHPFCLWEHHHNRVHHRYAAQLGLDNAFPPMTVAQYRVAGPARRAYYRFIRSLWGQPFFYLLDVWLVQMFLPFLARAPAMTRRAWFDLALVYVYFASFLTLTAYVSYEAAAGAETWFAAGVDAALFGFFIPFVLWNGFISFLSIVQHTGREVRWFVATGQPSTVEQSIAGTVHVVLPDWIDKLFHRIMQHQAHHLHVGIPLHRLKEAQAAVAASTGGRNVRVWTPAYHWRLTRECKLYDPLHNCWRGYDAVLEPAAVPRQELAA